ncbi:MAG: hypothetical protein PHN64_00230 [Desulfovibrionaceae bacterium]|nr:hypothetical protein [Desulfovibrionaceae bacterium]
MCACAPVAAHSSIKSSVVVAARLGYCLLGLHFSGWAALVPYTKMRLAVDEAALGMLLLCVGLGAVLAMPVAGVLTERAGCRRVLTVGIAGAFCMLCCPCAHSGLGGAVLAAFWASAGHY